MFTKTNSDVMAIGDGEGDATELAALLKAPGTAVSTDPTAPYRVAVESGSTTQTSTVNVFPTSDPTAAPNTKEAASALPRKPVVDAQGRVDCTGAVSCKTDPDSRVTTVTYPDGVVAIVQQINDLTVVAYKTLTEQLPPEVQAILPTLKPPAPLPTPSAAPDTPVPTPRSAPDPTTPSSSEAPVPSIDPGPPAPDSISLGPEDTIQRGPKVNVTRPPLDFSPGGGSGSGTPNGDTKPSIPSLDKVKDALGSAVNSVTDTINKALHPGASSKPGTGGPSGKSKSAESDSSGADSSP